MKKQEIKKKSFMNDDLLQKWVNAAEGIQLVSITNTQGGLTVWYYDTPEIVTVKGSDMSIGGKVKSIFGKKSNI